MSELTAVVPLGSGPGHGESFIWKGRIDAPVVAVDAGGASGVGKRSASHCPEILILSHDDQDHIRGAVDLIKTANQSLKELWVPVEWALLIQQLADTDPDSLFPGGSVELNMADFETGIAEQMTALESDSQSSMTVQLISQAVENLSSWDFFDFGEEDGFSIDDSSHHTLNWYGAKDLSEIVRRVQFRGNALASILLAAVAQSISIRFFSIDLAISQRRRAWEIEGKPGVATLANAVEFSRWRTVRIPPGLPHTYALTQLTVQNRRALCTLLWRDITTPLGGAIIWSDTDGNWLNDLSPLGLNRVIGSVIASSAPHHASSNSEHDRVWAELSSAPDDMIMISAGGQQNQAYRKDYLALGQQRCCTWCRPTPRQFQEVVASWNPSGQGRLHAVCIGAH